MEKLGRLGHHQLTVQFLTDCGGLVPLHYGQQYLVALLVAEHIEDSTSIQGVLQSFNGVTVGPVCVHTL